MTDSKCVCTAAAAAAPRATAPRLFTATTAPTTDDRLQHCQHPRHCHHTHLHKLGIQSPAQPSSTALPVLTELATGKAAEKEGWMDGAEGSLRENVGAVSLERAAPTRS
eukprot:2831330-Rhodomonas_salina.4